MNWFVVTWVVGGVITAICFAAALGRSQEDDSYAALDLFCAGAMGALWPLVLAIGLCAGFLYMPYRLVRKRRSQ